MQILGIDFTSAPSTRKPLVCAYGWLEGERLQIQRLEHWTHYLDFEQVLERTGPFVAGLDFPFAFPLAFSRYYQLPLVWEQAVAALERFHHGDHQQARAHYRQWIGAFRADQPPGAKHPRRQTDRLAGALSPLMVFGIPVGMMLLEGAVRLQRAGVTVPPLRPQTGERVALETYPALAVRRLLGEKVPYKNERQAGDQTLAANRARLLAAACGRPAVRTYGLLLQVAPPEMEACLQDHSGDRLDALLCALQAAWGYRQREHGWGVPPDLPEVIRRSEGWIIDPQTRADWQADPASTTQA